MNRDTRKPMLMNKLSGLALLIAATVEGMHILSGEAWRGTLPAANLFMMIGVPWIGYAAAVLLLKKNPNESYIWIGSAIIVLLSYGIFLRLGYNAVSYLYIGLAIVAALAQGLRVHFQGYSAISRNYPRPEEPGMA